MCKGVVFKRKIGRKSTISVKRSKILVKTTIVSEFGVNPFSKIFIYSNIQL